MCSETEWTGTEYMVTIIKANGKIGRARVTAADVTHALILMADRFKLDGAKEVHIVEISNVQD